MTVGYVSRCRCVLTLACHRASDWAIVRVLKIRTAKLDLPMNKVLIVDDHPVIRLAVRMLMERHGYEVIAETDNGVDALQIAREQIPDLVILDIGIPKLDGLEVILLWIL